MLTNQNIHQQQYGAGNPVAPPANHNPYFRGTFKNPQIAPTFALLGATGEGCHAVDDNGMPMACDPSDPSTWVRPLYIG